MKPSNFATLKWAALIVPMVAVPAFVFYATHRGAERAPPTAQPAPAAAEHGSAGLGTVLTRLENRLRAGGGSNADWELLAKTYDFVGRKADAAKARDAHVVAAPSAAANAADVQSGGPWSPDVVADFMHFGGGAAGGGAAGGGVVGAAPDASSTGTARPSDPLQRRVVDLLNAAERARKSGDFNAAKSNYEQVVALGRMSAQSWADYADVAVSLDGGQWNSEAQRYVEAALKLDPANQQALWLLGSAQHAGGRYSPAVATWNRLLELTPADAPEAAIFNANLAEDQRLAGGGAAARQAKPETGNARR